jgi:hypothetical protein
MSASANLILERRRTRRRFAFWRIIAIAAVGVAVIAPIPRAAGPAGASIWPGFETVA